MATQTLLSFPGSEIERVVHEDSRVTVSFSPFYILVSLGGAEERTRWRQAGEMVIEDARIDDDFPRCPCVVAAGEFRNNMYLYKDLVPLPLDSRGDVACTLRFEGTDDSTTLSGSSIRLNPLGERKYIEHIRPE
jgi:hypothetical protein